MTEPRTIPSTVPVEALAALVAPLGTLVEAVRLEGGYFATTYRVTLADGSRVVVKTAPTDASRLMTYEHDLIRTEALVYGLAAEHPALPMPRVLHTDFTRTLLPSDVVVASFLDGVPQSEAGFGPFEDDERAARARTDLGVLIGRLATVTGTVFGYPQSPALQAPTWRAAFTAIVEALLADAAVWDLDVSAARVRAALATHGHRLDEVVVPSIVHSDLWPGNLFVDTATGQIVGVIDPERAMWGDPLVDVVGADPMWDGLDRPQDVPLVAALDVSSPGAVTRLLLYRMWLGLVMTIEGSPRGYTGEGAEAYRATSHANVIRALDELDARAPQVS